MFRQLIAGSLVAVVACIALATDKPRRDPTEPARWQPVKTQAMSADAPVLMSVLIGRERKLVVIDGVLLEEGEEKNGLRVWRVEPGYAVVSIAGQSPQTLRMDTHDVNKEAR